LDAAIWGAELASGEGRGRIYIVERPFEDDPNLADKKFPGNPTKPYWARDPLTSTDGMTADYCPFEHAFLGRGANRIINELRGVNRVTCDITSKPPGTIEWE
jgi:hypothetical protein